MNVPITAIYASLTAVLIIILAWRVTKYRRTLKIGVGNGDNTHLSIAIRCHANTVEYAPIALLLLLIGELNGLSSLWLHIIGIVFVLSRLAHVWGLNKTQGGYSLGRSYGTAATWLVILTLSLINILILIGITI